MEEWLRCKWEKEGESTTEGGCRRNRVCGRGGELREEDRFKRRWGRIKGDGEIGKRDTWIENIDRVKDVKNEVGQLEDSHVVGLQVK